MREQSSGGEGMGDPGKEQVPTCELKVRDIISIHLGQAGLQIGTSVWELYGYEHNISADGELLQPDKDYEWPSKGGVGTQSFYKQIDCTNYYTPRAILVDLEPTVIESISASKYCKLFQSDYILKGTEDAANNFARGFHTVGKQMVTPLTQMVRRQAESSERVQGFMLFHSMGGGTGSGLGSRLIESLSEEFPKQASVELGVFPSPKAHSAVVEPYNTILATHKTIDTSKCVIFTDNEATQNNCDEMHDINRPFNRNLNNILSQAVSSMTTGLRFDCQLMTDFFDFQTNLIPYPRLHFPVVSLSPVVGRQFNEYWTVNDITTKVFEPCSRLARYPGQEGKQMACCLLYRGDVAAKDVNEAVINLKKSGLELVSWIPTGFKVGIGSKPPTAVMNDECVTSMRSVCLMSNNNGLRHSWKELARKYNLMLKKGAFLHWYVGEGLEQSDFKEALENMETLLDDYLAMNE